MLDTLSPLLDAAVQLAAVFVLAITPVLVRAGLAWLERKTALEFSKAQEERVERLVADAVHYAEESARKRIKAGEKAAGEPGYKMQKALAFASQEAERLGLRSLIEQGAEHLSDKLEARLGRTREEAQLWSPAAAKGEAGV